MGIITRLSHSTVSDLADCGEKVRLKKVEQVVPVPSLALAGGSAVHEATANLDMLDFGAPVKGPLSFEDAFENELRGLEEESGMQRKDFRVSGKATKAFPNKEDLQWWYVNGQVFVDNWRRFLKGSPYQIALTPECTPAIEIDVFGEVGGAPVKGYIDRVLEDPAGNLFIVDLKTGVRRPKPNQLLLYRILLKQIFAEQWTPKFGFYYMNRTAEMSWVENLETLDNGATEYEYRMAWVGVQAGVFMPNTTSGWCSTCDVARYCYAQNGEESGMYSPFRKGIADES